MAFTLLIVQSDFYHSSFSRRIERDLPFPDGDKVLFVVTLFLKATEPKAGISNWKVPFEHRSESSKFKIALSELIALIPVNELRETLQSIIDASPCSI